MQGESPMMDQNIMDESNTGPKTTIGGGYSIVEQMINNKSMRKAKEDIKKIKGVVSEMQINVTEHSVIINSNLVTEEKLRIALELIEN